jgi:hypothetical protein
MLYESTAETATLIIVAELVLLYVVIDAKIRNIPTTKALTPFN